jgi:energy-coupling factor transporter ATP-binding protein EcfA2
MDALTLAGVRYCYPGAATDALADVSLRVAPGELVLVIGESGCGKSTLLRAAAGLVPHFHGGELAGRVVTAGLDTRDHRPGAIAARAGLVFQDPEAQIVSARVDREAAFGLESLGCPPAEIALRAEEALMLVGASRLAERGTATLSGGERQRVAIASVLAMGQELLLLDEPTSQLDPAAAEEVLALVTRLAHERGVAVVLAEHRTGRLFAAADRVVVMAGGRIAFDGPPPAAARHLAAAAPALLPPVAHAFAAAGRPELPLTVRDARRLAALPPAPPPPAPAPRPPAVAIRNGWKRLGATEALRGATATLAAGEVCALVGENGAGKTTLALAAARLSGLDRGRIEGAGRVGYVSQNPAHYLLRETVAGEVEYGLEQLGVPVAERRRRRDAALAAYGLAGLADRHPADLSSGERQRLAIAAVAVTEPDVLLLDEPTRGVDGARKDALAALLRRVAAAGAGVGVITHDVDFAAEAADVVTALARGRVLVDRAPAALLCAGGAFASQAGLAFGRPSVPAAAAALAAARETKEAAGVT